MRKIITIDLTELRSMTITLNAYLALMSIKWGDLKYNITIQDLEELVEGNWIESVHTKVLSPKAIIYFNNFIYFEKFYEAFPFTVEGSYGEERPLRNKNIDTNGAKVTKSIWKNKTRGNVEFQKKIIEVLEAEIEWRKANNTLKFMNNIDTWLRQNNWEKYQYLLNNKTTFKSNTKRL